MYETFALVGFALVVLGFLFVFAFAALNVKAEAKPNGSLKYLRFVNALCLHGHRDEA